MEKRLHYSIGDETRAVAGHQRTSKLYIQNLLAGGIAIINRCHIHPHVAEVAGLSFVVWAYKLSISIYNMKR